ncbi:MULTISPECIES: lipoprotein [unclassified Nitrosomonas]|nr:MULTISPECIES: lipoprotein [unclassified Nitrosomonas]
MHHVHLLYIVVLLPLWLTACGLKGPLYLPQNEAPPASQSSQDEQTNQ